MELFEIAFASFFIILSVAVLVLTGMVFYRLFFKIPMDASCIQKEEENEKKEAQWTRPFFTVIAVILLLMVLKVISIGLFGFLMLLTLLTMLFFLHSRHKAEKNKQEIVAKPSASLEKTRGILNNKMKKSIALLFYAALLIILFSGFAKDLGMISENAYYSIVILFFSGGYIAILYNLINSLFGYNWKNWPEMFQQENPEPGKFSTVAAISFFSMAITSLSYMVWRFWKYDLLSDQQVVLFIAVVLSLAFTGFILKRKFQGISFGIREIISHPIRNFGLVLLGIISTSIGVVYVGALFYII